LGLNKREQDSIVWQDVKRLGSAEAEKILGFPLDVNTPAAETPLKMREGIREELQV
jgi:hypothetical protein